MQPVRIQGHKYLWQLPQTDQKLVLDCAQNFNLAFPIAQTLISRGFQDLAQIRDFLFSSFEKDVPHASGMKDADRAVDRLMLAIKNDEKILIAGDYDVDGITSSALIMYCMNKLGAKVNFFLPNRVRDGYGLSVKTVERAAKSGYSVIITVDNGITAFEPALKAKELGIDLIITDHHRSHDHLPAAYAIVDPNQTGCPYPYKHLAGVGVSFKIMGLLYERLGLELPERIYELLLLGTVADVVPLVGENRYWVRHGLNYVNKIESMPLKILKENGKFAKQIISSIDIGFLLTPQINALGRLEDPRDGVQFLIGSNELVVKQVGQVLLQLNQARKEIEKKILDEVVAKIEAGAIDLSRENVIIAASDSWAPGVIGLVASRLVGKYGKPTLLFHLTKDGLAKGSCRSIPEFSIFDALAKNSDLIQQFGGHHQAAGLALKVENLSLLKSNLEKLVAEQLTPEDLTQKLALDAELALPDLDKNFMRNLSFLEPFGHQNSCPSFYLKNVVLVQQPILMKELHVKCQVFAQGIIKPVVFFNRPELYDSLIKHGDKKFDLAVQVTENHWQGRVNIELQGIDIAGL